MAGGGSGGGGTTTSTTKAEFPEEFRPLATSAVGQIQDLQDVLPLAPFAQSRVTPVAPLSGLQQAQLQLAPQLFNPLGSTNSLRNLANPFNMGLSGLSQAGGPTSGGQQALNALAASGRVGGATLSPSIPAPQITQSASNPFVNFPSVNFAPPPTPTPGAGSSQNPANIALQNQIAALEQQIQALPQASSQQAVAPSLFRVGRISENGDWVTNLATQGPNGQFIDLNTGNPVPSGFESAVPVV